MTEDHLLRLVKVLPLHTKDPETADDKHTFGYSPGMPVLSPLWSCSSMQRGWVVGNTQPEDLSSTRQPLNPKFLRLARWLTQERHLPPD